VTDFLIAMTLGGGAVTLLYIGVGLVYAFARGIFTRGKHRKSKVNDKNGEKK
jgi:hypothetical protein